MALIASIPVEIIFIDDMSSDRFKQINRTVSKLAFTEYFELPKNTGRAAIRNILTRSAKYSSLIFIDSDSLFPDKEFLQRYIGLAGKYPVVCGGTIYNNYPPGIDSMLRWVYGRAREQKTAAKRNRVGFAITTNNFLIDRDLLIQHPFRENIRGYGHEDTVLGYDLQQAGIKISHIDNPVIHIGLENSIEYLSKTRQAIRNLLNISKNYIQDDTFQNHSGLLRFRRKMKSWGLIHLTRWLFKHSRKIMENHLTGSKPRLLVFDLYRMLYTTSI
jgi:glycosyltransferase involved in cell wall biosynthesis